ncbi:MULTISPECIES: DUF6931 family protein [unclassified Vibrio]|uniref:DUF6931 family protein n=1 Tax=unclassified Vibrio TaxID=2614977 RepID=UPI001361DC54|nr:MULTISPECIES: hypothetical protein [unclassified Vibrio]NAW59569.1 hypothetical protein [Vibrio sp. V36_P2S2PM302]NAX20590.1 hypothetical protein [Vibrio sp. V39_P1S14PM300]NAX24267.1 hypothetical protein [Vibrio sp. V38_P2S17PM301]NAX29048.1 hypothetical protein [Vibrio sp. V37_P2S8PM304]
MEYKKIPFAAGIQVLNRFNASDEAKALINDEMSVTNSIQTLSEHELNFDLIQFLAHALPVRECIWWASLCLHKRHDDWNASQLQCISLAKQWVQSPSEELRRKAELFATRLQLNCGPSWLAQAVFWNGAGSIVTPDLPVVLPDPNLYAKAAAGAVNHAAALPVWDNSALYYQYALDTALKIAQGYNPEE